MSTRKCYYVSKTNKEIRQISPGIRYDVPMDLLAMGINPCSYKYTNEVIEQLNNVISNNLDEYIWGGGERTIFVSDFKSTLVTDNFGWAKNFQIPTSEILMLMLTYKNLFDISTKINIKEIVSDAFEEITKKNSKHLFYHNEFIYIKENAIEGIDIVMTLLDTDFEIDKSLFSDSLVFDENYI